MFERRKVGPPRSLPVTKNYIFDLFDIFLREIRFMDRVRQGSIVLLCSQLGLNFDSWFHVKCKDDFLF